MRKFVFLLALLTLSTTYSQKILNLKDFEIEKYKDITPIVVKALKKCKEEGISKLIFPKGTYHFYPTFAPERYCEITNNDNGLKRTAFPLIDFHNFVVDGGGSDFIFHGKMIPFIIEKSSNTKVTNLSVDWDVPFMIEGLVVANNPTTKTFDIEVKTPYLVKYGHLYITLEREDSPYERKYGKRFAFWEHYNLEVGQNIFWDPKTMAPLYNTKQYNMPEKGINAEELKKGLIRITTKMEKLPPLGSVMVSKGEYLENRTSPAFRVFKSKDLEFKNVNVYHAGAMGLIAERSENITLDSFNVVLREGSGRMITTTADATHFCNVKGMVTIKNCTFENMLDDATNIHGTYVRVNKIIDDYTLAVETYHPHQNGYLFGEEGDEVQIIDQLNLQPTTEPMVLKKVERVNEKISYITFDKPITNKVQVYDGVENISWHASAIIENNIVRNNRARSLLISTPRKVVVRNNHLSSQMASFRLTGDLGLWNESGPNDGLLIENNVIENAVYGGNGPQSIFLIDPQYVDKKNFKGMYSRDITIRNNTIKTFDNSILVAMSVNGLIFENNTIIQTDTYKPIFPNVDNIQIINCNDVHIQGNTYKRLDSKKGTLSIDKKSTNIQIDRKDSFYQKSSK
ncbi:right-handed parallel beta-helix repeat-containing protein [Polaribacter litorisediminis]|uniref:alpha-1,3-galactosidase-related protein n=1 Tax=Polaribacter litorisediminis TaxID=1908341 RepID=UPI001CBB1027|nr:right-handed parallel beta-helix repeat-containing protein [Polaribacter litorisediminis]UAM98313.1 right-handed parallel beta-helix repeat-containing protein [Polaribacter litorisediminis]